MTTAGPAWYRMPPLLIHLLTAGILLATLPHESLLSLLSWGEQSESHGVLRVHLVRLFMTTVTARTVGVTVETGGC